MLGEDLYIIVYLCKMNKKWVVAVMENMHPFYIFLFRSGVPLS